MGVLNFLNTFFENPFVKNKVAIPIEIKEEKVEPIKILENAISDIGLWTWLSIDSANHVQIEFDWVQLYLHNKESKVQPSNHISLGFKNATSVTALYKEGNTLPNDWLELFEKDKLEPFYIDYEHFSFDKNVVAKIFSSAVKTETIIGEKYSNAANGVMLGFWTNEVGIIIVADSMKIVDWAGEIDIDKIPELNTKWWEYWRRYWDLKKTKTPMDTDPLCEITIPTG